MRKPRAPDQIERGKRFKQAAHRAKFTSAGIAETVGVEDGTVRGWWAGMNVPSPEKVRRYADATGVSVNWLLYGGEQKSLAGWRLRYAELIREGVDPLEALDMVTGPPQTPGEAPTEEEAMLLSGGGPSARDVIEGYSADQWDLLTTEQRSAVLALIEAIATGNRELLRATADPEAASVAQE